MLQYLQLEREVPREGTDPPPLATPPQGRTLLGLGGRDEYCVRTVVVRYYMLDHTIEVVEPRVSVRLKIYINRQWIFLKEYIIYLF